MKNAILLYLYQFRIFWKMRTLVSRGLFWIKAKRFSFRYSFREERANYQPLHNLFSVTQRQLFIVIGFGLFLQFIDPYLYPFFKYIDFKIPDDSDYVTLLATISGIGGVFIGLYYAGLAAVSGAIYARVPNNVRDLLIQDRFGNVYLRLLSFFTFLGIVLIALRVLGYPRIFLAILLVTIGSGIGIISFVKLGQRVFNLFDPTVLSQYLFEQFLHWLKMVKCNGYRWEDMSFQKHAHKQASNLLDTFDTLAENYISKNSSQNFLELKLGLKPCSSRK